MKRSLFIAAIIAVTLASHVGPGALAEQAEAESPSYGRLQAELRGILADADLGSATVGVIVTDVETGEVVVEQRADTLLNPASNAKIITAAAALSLLGPEYRFVTALYGDAEGTAIDGPLYLRGRGDPTLFTEDIWGLAVQLSRRGIRVVRGDIIVDDSYFDDSTEPPAFDQQPNERSYFRAAVGAVNVNRNVVSVHVRPSAQPGRPAIVTPVPDGYLRLINDTVTVSEGAPSIRFSTRPDEGGTQARVWGSLPVGHHGVRQRSRIDNPSLFAGASLNEALESLGITVVGRVREGVMSPPAPLLARHTSEPLSALMWVVGKNSDNFTAETLLITLGAQGVAPGTWERGCEAARGYLESIGIEQGSYQLVNGSGLFDANRYTPRQIGTVLRAAWLDQTIRAEFISQLATGGVDGTLRRRFRQEPARRNVRAKTGTLSDVTALSGYVLAPGGRNTLAFSILVNNARGRLGGGRQLQNELVEAIARYLHRD